MNVPIEDLSNPSGTATLVNIATRAAAPQHLADDTSTLVIPGDSRVALLNDEATHSAPNRKRGGVEFLDADSLATYVNRHKSAGSTAYVNDRTAQINVVLNDHADEAGWGDHTATLVARKTEEWTAWLASNDKLMGQGDFSEHIERHLDDVVEPNGADLLELAQTFQAKTKVEFRESRQLVNGQRQFEYVENIDASGGKKGELTIPKEFILGIAPYEGGESYRVTARLRYQIREGKLSLGYVLSTPTHVEREAFASIAAKAQTATEIDFLRGEVTWRHDPDIVSIVSS